MNFETVVMNQENYNYQEPYTVSEHIFWNWLIKNGFVINSEEVSKNVFREKDYKSGNVSKDRLVQCFGAIDAGNSLSTEFGMFNETYVTIPTSYGNGPVFFRNVSDNPNFQTNFDYAPADAAKLEGRTGEVAGYVDTTPEYTANNLYKSEKAYEIVKDFPTIQNALRNMTSEDFKSTININSYDDVNVDADNVLFNVDSESYDMVNKSCEFNFNAILLYYSIYDLNDSTRESIATNLFGIVFLDGGSVSSDTHMLAPLTKKKSYSGNGATNAYFGNSYSFRVNIKTLGVYDNTDAVIQDNTTTTDAYSSNFNDVLYNLNKIITVLNTNVQTTSRIQDQYMKMLDYYVDIKNKFNDFENDSSIMVNNQLNGSKSELQKYVDDKLAETIEILNGPRDVINMISGSDVVVDASGFMNIQTSDMVFRLGTLAGDVDCAEVRCSDLLSDVVRMKNDIDNIESNLANLSSQTGGGADESYIEPMMFSAPVQEEAAPAVSLELDFNAVDSYLKTLGIVKCCGIMTAKKKFTEDMPYGLYLKKNTAGNITTVIEHTETEDKSDKCKYGLLYSVEGVLYVFNGTTCTLLGEA